VSIPPLARLLIRAALMLLGLAHRLIERQAPPPFVPVVVYEAEECEELGL